MAKPSVDVGEGVGEGLVEVGVGDGSFAGDYGDDAGHLGMDGADAVEGTGLGEGEGVDPTVAARRARVERAVERDDVVVAGLVGPADGVADLDGEVGGGERVRGHADGCVVSLR